MFGKKRMVCYVHGSDYDRFRRAMLRAGIEYKKKSTLFGKDGQWVVINVDATNGSNVVFEYVKTVMSNMKEW